MAVKFTRTSKDRVSTNTVPYSQLGSSPLTVSLWFRPHTSAVVSVLFGLSNGGIYHSGLYDFFTAPGKIIYALSQGTSTADQSSGTSNSWAFDTWHHAAYVLDGAASRIAYLDGQSDTAGTVNIDPAGLSLLEVGAINGSATSNIYVAHFALWTRALSANEIGELANGEWPNYLPESLWSYLPLLGDVRDEVGLAEWEARGTSVTFDNTIDPLVRRTRLGAYSGPRWRWGLFSKTKPAGLQPLVQQRDRLGPYGGPRQLPGSFEKEIPGPKLQQDRLGLYGGPRQVYGSFAPKAGAAPAAPTGEPQNRQFMANLGRLMGLR